MRRLDVALFVGLVLLGSVAQAQWSPYEVDEHTLALYHLDTETGDTTPDEVGLHDATLFGDAYIGGGRFDGGLVVDGDGDYARCGGLGSPEAGTVECWVYLNPGENAGDYFVILGAGREYGGCWDNGWFLGVHMQFQSHLAFGVWNGGWEFASSGVLPEDLEGAWHHVAGTWGPDGVEVWIDGELKGTHASTVRPDEYVTALIGTDSWTWDTSGVIDEVRVSDIQRDFYPIPEPSLIGLVAAGLFGVLARRRR